MQCVDSVASSRNDLAEIEYNIRKFVLMYHHLKIRIIIFSFLEQVFFQGFAMLHCHVSTVAKNGQTKISSREGLLLYLLVSQLLG